MYLVWRNANSEEFDPQTPDPVIHIMDDQKTVEDKGATMRLGACPCSLKKGSFAYNAYEKKRYPERHRHRFEFNNSYREQMEEKGLIISGRIPSETWSKSLKSKITHGMWAFSFIRNSSPSPTRPILFSLHLSKLRLTINWQMFSQAMVLPSKALFTVLNTPN